MKTETYNIAGHYLSAIVNNDYSGLNSEETSKLNTWLALRGLSFTDPIKWQGEGFCKCEVSGLKADCYTVSFKIK